MGVIVQDSGRYMVWAGKAVEAGVATGAIVSPYDTPVEDVAHRKTADQVRGEVTAAGGELIFDPCTQALALDGCNKVDFYPQWRLWGASRDLTDETVRSEHVLRCFAAADKLGAPRLAPTVLVGSPVSAEANIALHLARSAGRQSPGCWLAISGTPDFWRSGHLLDEFVGAVAALRPEAVVLSVVRPKQTYPAISSPDEIAGLCRTTMALALRARVIISHGDLAGLPAVAAGATDIGSGWDLGQRCLSPERFQRSTGGGTPVERVTHRGLLASLSGTDAETIRLLDEALSWRLVAGVKPGDGPTRWTHHARILSETIADLELYRPGGPRARRLLAWYRWASREFRSVAAVHTLPAGQDKWCDPFRDGTLQWLRSERSR